MYMVILLLIFSRSFAMDDPATELPAKEGDKRLALQEELFMKDLEGYLKKTRKQALKMNEERIKEDENIKKHNGLENFTYYTPEGGPFYFEEERKKLPNGTFSIKRTLVRNWEFEKKYTQLLGGLNALCKEYRTPSMYRILENFLEGRTFNIDQLKTLTILGGQFETSYNAVFPKDSKEELKSEDQRLRRSFKICLFNVQHYKQLQDTWLRLTNFDHANDIALQASASAPALPTHETEDIGYKANCPRVRSRSDPALPTPPTDKKPNKRGSVRPQSHTTRIDK